MAGAVGVNPLEFTIRELWLMYAGKMRAIRQQCLWQSAVIFAEKKFDVVGFLRYGTSGEKSEKLTIPDWLRAQVDAEIGRLNGVNPNGKPL